MQSQRTSTKTLSRKLQRNASSLSSANLANENHRRTSRRAAATLSSPICAVTSESDAEQRARQHEQGNGPGGLGEQALPQRRSLDFAQENRRRKVSHVLEWQQFQNRRGGLRQQVDGKHVAGDEVVQRVDDIEQRSHFQQPKTDHANAGLKVEADSERQKQRQDVRREGRHVGNVFEVVAAQREQNGVRNERSGDVGDLVGHAVDDEVAKHVERLEQVLLQRAFANVQSDSARQAGHAGEHPRNVHQQQIGDHLFQAEST